MAHAMTAPATWYPQANPGGQMSYALRQNVVLWIRSRQIAGVAAVYAEEQYTEPFDDRGISGDNHTANVWIDSPDDSEDREAYTGPDNRGGKLVHFTVEAHVDHFTYAAEAPDDDEQDFLRIVDALRDCLRGPGRDLGRQDLYLSAGEYPRQGGITFAKNRTVLVSITGGSSAYRSGVLTFTVSQYLNDPTAE